MQHRKPVAELVKLVDEYESKPIPDEIKDTYLNVAKAFMNDLKEEDLKKYQKSSSYEDLVSKYNTKKGHKRAKSKDGYIFWALAWNYLYNHGPMRKLDLMKAMNDEGLTTALPTSNVSTFAKLNKEGIICGVKGKLEARLPEEWKI